MIRVRALGQNVIEVKRRAIRPDAELIFATLLYLAAERGRRVERENLAALLWPHANAARRRHGLRQILYKLRQLGIETGDAADSLTIAASEVWLDCDDADASEDRRTQRELAATGGVRCLPGYAPKLSRAYSDWLDGFRARAEASARRRLVAAIVQARRAGRWEEVEPLAHNCLQLDPLNEEATLALAESIALAGAKSKAVAMLDAYIAEVGPNAGDVRVPATVLRRRIADQLGPRRLKGPLETKLIGREDVMEVLTAALESTRAGHSATHVLWGVSGIGKTRVLEEVSKLAALMGATSVTQRAAPDDEFTPGLTLVRLARAMLVAPGSLGLAPDVLALLQRVTAQVTESGIGSDFDVSEDALVRSIVDLERSLSWERPVVVALDDFHFADPLTRRVLSRAQGCLTSEPVLLLMASVEEPSVSGLGRIATHQMGRLATDACVRLARALLEKAGADCRAEVVDSLAAASGGHPFVLREAVIAWLQNDGGSSSATLDQVLQQRVARLSDDARELLLSGLVLAEHATLPLLLRSTALSEGAFERAIVELEGEQILVCTPNGRIAIHNLWLSSVENLFSRARLSVRRLAIARLLEAASMEGTEAAERLVASAGHFLRAGDSLGAARVLAKGGTALKDRALAPAAWAAFSKAVHLDPASDAFEQCVVQSLVAAQQAELHEEALSLIDRFGPRIRTSTRLSETERNEIEVINFEVRQASIAYTDDSSACIELLSRENLTGIQRLRTALVGVRCAEHSHDPDRVNAILDLVPTAVPNEAEESAFARRQLAMVAAIASRNISAARALAEFDLEEISTGRFNRNRIRALLNNRIPYWFDCDFERVGRIVDAVRQRVSDYPSTFVALRTEDIYATHCIDMMQLEQASEIIARAAGISKQFGYELLEMNFQELGERLAVASGDASIELLRASVPESELGSPSLTRVRVIPLCSRTVLSARAKDKASISQMLPELRRYWTLIQRGCPFDYPCVALGIALVASGERTEGEEVIADYWRRTRVTSNPPSPFIAALATEFGLRLG